ncbi:MAG: response regulator transcription factor [Bacteroidota bacterium]
MISVLIADDHQMFRQGIISLLSDQDDITFVGEASNGQEVLNLSKETSPDLILLDVEMPKMDGFETMRRLKTWKSPPKVLVLTMHKTPEFTKNIVQAGASGLVQKDAGKELLLKSIRQIVHEGKYFSDDINALLLESLHGEQKKTSLSKREKEVVKLIVDGLTTKEIADKLFLSKHTIESHRQNILLKLELKNTAELVKYAIQHGLA